MSHRDTSADRSKKPLDAAKLDELALAYVARYATSKGKLARYLSRKVAESKWIDTRNSEESIQSAIERMESLKYLDDSQYAQLKSGAMMRRGLGPQRIRAQLRFDGVSDADREEALDETGQETLIAAVRFAQRRRVGPFAIKDLADRAEREKHVAAFIRAGHSQNLARKILAMEAVEWPELQLVVEKLEDDLIS